MGSAFPTSKMIAIPATARVSSIECGVIQAGSCRLRKGAVPRHLSMTFGTAPLDLDDEAVKTQRHQHQSVQDRPASVDLEWQEARYLAPEVD